MRLSTPCSRIRSSGGDTSLFFFSSSLASRLTAAPTAAVARTMPPAFKNFLRLDWWIVFIDFSDNIRSRHAGSRPGKQSRYFIHLYAELVRDGIEIPRKLLGHL